MKNKKPLLIVVGGLLIFLVIYLFSGPGSDDPRISGGTYQNFSSGAFLQLDDDGRFTLWVSDKTQKPNDKGHYRIVKLFTGSWDTEVIDEDLNDWLRDRFENDDFLELLKRDNIKFANLLVNCVEGDVVYQFDNFEVVCKENSDDALAACERINQQLSSALTWTRSPAKVGFIRESEPNYLYFQLTMDFLGNKSEVLEDKFAFRFRKVDKRELQKRIEESSKGGWETREPEDSQSASSNQPERSSENPSSHESGGTSPDPKSNGIVIVDDYVGGGVEATASSTVEILYTATLADGTEFDKVDDRTSPYRMAPSGDVLVGLKQGVVGMRVGGKRRITIPPALAFGSKGMGTAVPPDATVVYSVELVKVSGS